MTAWRSRVDQVSPMSPELEGKMFTCEQCGVNSADGFIMPDGRWLCTPAKTVQEKIDAWRNCNGIQQSPKSNDNGEKTMAEKTKLVADFSSAENVGPNERSEFALGLVVALLLQLSTIEQIQSALATIKGGYS